MEIPARKWISKSSPLVPATYQGCLQSYWGHFGEGPGVWGWRSGFGPPFGREKCDLQSGINHWIVWFAIVLLSACKFINNVQFRRAQIKIMTSHVSSPKWPPPLTNPFLTPHTNENGVNLLRIQAAICLHGSYAKLCNTWRAKGQKLVCACSCTDHLFSAQIQPKPLPKHNFTSIMQLLHNAMRNLQVWNQLLVICLNTPPRPTWGRSMHFYDQAPRPPL
jgi:hypothetical protein